MVGMGKGAERHILIKDAFALENLCKVDTIVLDKTGTLTEGVPVVTDSYWISDDNTRYLDILYTAEQKSEHPLASAIIRWLEDSGAKVCETENFESLTGRGVRIQVEGATYWSYSRPIFRKRHVSKSDNGRRRGKVLSFMVRMPGCWLPWRSRTVSSRLLRKLLRN